MSKKKFRQFGGTPYSQPVNNAAVSETGTIRHDLVQTIIVNVIFIAVLIGLYFWDKSSGEPLSNLVGEFL